MLSVVLYQRFLLNVDTGGRGVVSIFVPTLLLVGLICLPVGSQSAGRVHWARLIVVWGLYWACVGLLPLLAVSIGGYSTRAALSSVTEAIVPMAVVGVGVRIATLTRDPSRVVAVALAVAVPIVLAYTVGQWAYNSGFVDATIWRPIADWDRAAADAFGVLQLSRSSGPYVNPNILGAWGAIAFVLAATLHPGRVTRPVIMGAAALTVIFAQSRGSLVALVAGAMALVVLALGHRIGGASRPGFLPSLLAATGFVVVGVGMAGADLSGVTRLLEGLSSLLPGATFDPSITGRLDSWSAAGALSAIYPMGTWGPPEVLLGGAIDNDWVRLFLQATVAGVAGLGVMLVGGILVADRSRPIGAALTACSVVIAIAALTQTTLTYPPITLYWLVVGISVVRPAGEHGPRRDAASERPYPTSRWRS